MEPQGPGAIGLTTLYAGGSYAHDKALITSMLSTRSRVDI